MIYGLYDLLATDMIMLLAIFSMEYSASALKVPRPK